MEERGEHESIAREAREKLEREGCKVISRPRLRAVSVPLTGEPDLLALCPGKCIVVEVKTRPPRTGLEELQARAYHLLASETPACKGKVVEAFIVWPGGQRRIEPGPGEVARLARSAQRVLKLSTPPMPTRPASACRACELARICPHAP